MRIALKMDKTRLKLRVPDTWIFLDSLHERFLVVFSFYL